MRIVVLGAGVVGTASAWYLACAGHEVTVHDRQPEAGLQTSFANGGQVSVSHAEPWANPTAPFKVLQWLGREDAPLLFRARADLGQWMWGARFLFECLPWRTRRNTEAAFALASYSRDCLRELRRETGIRYDESARGILHIYTERGLFDHAHTEVALLRARGMDVQIKSPEECIAIEPALAHAKDELYGGAYAATDESGDAHMFTQALAALARQQGVRFRFNVSVTGIEHEGGSISRVVIDDEVGIEESVRADAYLVSLGSYSPIVLRGVGISVPIYPVKGYSITIPLDPQAQSGHRAPTVSLTDHARKIVVARLGNRLRVAGTAELAGYDTGINEVRCRALVNRCFELFPEAGDPEDALFWTGLRPSTPSNVPIIGRTRYSNLYLNTGHGTLGWTMACGAGRAIADIASGKKPEPEFCFLGTA